MQPLKSSSAAGFIQIREALAGAADELRRSGIEAPRRTAELLLTKLLGWDRSRVLAQDRSELDPDTLKRFQRHVRRRAAGEPLQYITEEQEFFGMRFRVGPPVLIPRPETEILVETALRLASGMEGVVRFADVGTGSGCIAIAFAGRLERARGCAVDVSPEALALARENAERNGVAERIRWICGDLLEGLNESLRFDLVLSNPPYVSLAEAADLPSQVRGYEPHTALFAGESGMDCIDRLAPVAAKRLRPGGYLLLEIGFGQENAAKLRVDQAGLTVIETKKDLRGIPRCLIARKGPAGTRG